MFERFTEIVSPFSSFLHFSSITKIESHLRVPKNKNDKPKIIVIDIKAGLEAITRCRQLLQNNGLGDTFIIAVIDQFNDCQAVLDHGADDYFQLPLVPKVVQTRLMTFLNSASSKFPNGESNLLSNEKGNLHQQQAERFMLIGRLTASLSHEINNPMQAIQGALVLALEELNNSQKVAEYIQLSLKEAEKVTQLVTRMRQIYRPKVEFPKEVDINKLLREVIAISHKELKRKKVTLYLNLEADLPPVVAIVNQLQLVFLNIILNLGDVIGMTGGGELNIVSRKLGYEMQIEILVNVAPETFIKWGYVLTPTVKQSYAQFSLGLSMSQEIISTHGGTFTIYQNADQAIFTVKLPLFTHDPVLLKREST